MNWRLQILLHDFVGHPIAALLWLLDLKRRFRALAARRDNVPLLTLRRTVR